MKHAVTIILLALMAIGLAAWYGNRLISSRHRIGKYTYTLSSSNSTAITGHVVWSGMQLALQSCGMNPNTWALSPASEWQPANVLSGTNTNRASALIILSNQTDRSELYVRVEPSVASAALEYHLYRPK